MDSEKKMNVGVKIACAVLLVAVVTAAGVGLLVQHRKLDEQRQAQARLESANQQLVAKQGELVAANAALEGELIKLRDVERARVTAAEKERAALKAERESLAKRAAQALDDVKKARAAQNRAAKEVAGLKAQIKDLTSANKKLRAERESIRAKCESLERELNEAMQPAQDADAPSPAPASAQPPAPLPAPTPDKRTPEEREAHDKEELNDLLNLR